MPRYRLDAIASLLILSAALLPGVAYGCMVCGVATEDTKTAFVVTTGILTVVPLSLIFGIIYVIYRRAVALARSDDFSRRAEGHGEV